MKNKFWIIGVISLIIFLLLCIIYYINTTIEGYQASCDNTCPKDLMTHVQYVHNANCQCVAPVQTSDAYIRENATCSDSNQYYMYDRFSKAVFADMTKPLNKTKGACSYESTLSTLGPYKDAYDQGYVLSNWNGIENLCIAKCPYGFKPYDKDDTLCIADKDNYKCKNTPDLSSNILQSWEQVCGPFMRTELILNSTLNSISNVTSTLNSQYSLSYLNMTNLSNNIFSYTGPNRDNNITNRTTYFPKILDNYYNLSSITLSTNNNYVTLSTSKDVFDKLYFKMNCDTYTH